MALSACNHAVFTSSKTAAQVVPQANRSLHASAFRGDTAVLQRTRTADVVRPRQYALEVQSFKFMKKLGLKKPEFLPDFGKDKRLAVLNSFFTSTDPTTLGALLSDNAKVVEEGPQPRTYNKSEFINLVCNHVSPAIPDFNWGHATSGENDKEGYAVVTCQASGQHTGKALRIPGSELPKVEAQQKQFKLQPADLKVKVEDGKIQEIVMPSSEAGFSAIYQAVGGKARQAPSAF